MTFITLLATVFTLLTSFERILSLNILTYDHHKTSKEIANICCDPQLNLEPLTSIYRKKKVESN